MTIHKTKIITSTKSFYPKFVIIKWIIYLFPLFKTFKSLCSPQCQPDIKNSLCIVAKIIRRFFFSYSDPPSKMSAIWLRLSTNSQLCQRQVWKHTLSFSLSTTLSPPQLHLTRGFIICKPLDVWFPFPNSCCSFLNYPNRNYLRIDRW